MTGRIAGLARPSVRLSVLYGLPDSKIKRCRKGKICVNVSQGWSYEANGAIEIWLLLSPVAVTVMMTIFSLFLLGVPRFVPPCCFIPTLTYNSVLLRVFAEYLLLFWFVTLHKYYLDHFVIWFIIVGWVVWLVDVATLGRMASLNVQCTVQISVCRGAGTGVGSAGSNAPPRKFTWASNMVFYPLSPIFWKEIFSGTHPHGIYIIIILYSETRSRTVFFCYH